LYHAFEVKIHIYFNGFKINRLNPVETCTPGFSQGSGHAATLGYMPESLWGSMRAFEMNEMPRGFIHTSGEGRPIAMRPWIGWFSRITWANCLSGSKPGHLPDVINDIETH